MNTTRTAVAAFAAAALVAGALAPAAFAAPKKDRSCMAVVVGSPQKLGKSGKNLKEKEFENNITTFEATKVQDIDFAIMFSPTVATQFSNVHIVEFRILTPEGNLYQSISIPMTTDATKKGQKHFIPGYPDLVPIQILQPITHGFKNAVFATVTLPVAGTPIVSNSLYGKWTAMALVEDEVAPCSTPATFNITQ